MGQRGGFRGCTIWFTGECAFLSNILDVRLYAAQNTNRLILSRLHPLLFAIAHLVPRNTSKIEITILCPGAEILLGPKYLGTV